MRTSSRTAWELPGQNSHRGLLAGSTAQAASGRHLRTGQDRTGKSLAAGKHIYLEDYLKRFPELKQNVDISRLVFEEFRVRGHKAIHVVNPNRRADHLHRLAAAGIDAAAAEQGGQLEVRINTDVYLPDGRFDPDRMIAVFEQLASGNAQGGFPLSRICCRMDWAVEDQSHVDDVIEFESRVNEVWRRHDDAVICTYHLGQFGAEAVIDIMRTHPMVIIGGMLQQNPFYVPPDEFLREFRQRRAGRNSSSAAA